MMGPDYKLLMEQRLQGRGLRQNVQRDPELSPEKPAPLSGPSLAGNSFLPKPSFSI